MNGAKICVPALEDYYECLHHRKEVPIPTPSSSLAETLGFDHADTWDAGLQKARAIELQRAYRRAEAAHPRENAPRPGAIRNLGLLNKEEDTKDVLGTDRSINAGNGK